MALVEFTGYYWPWTINCHTWRVSDVIWKTRRGWQTSEPGIKGEQSISWRQYVHKDALLHVYVHLQQTVKFSLSLCSSLFSIDIRVSFDNIISIFLSLQLFSKVFNHIFGEYGIKLVLNSSCVYFSWTVLKTLIILLVVNIYFHGINKSRTKKQRYEWNVSYTRVWAVTWLHNLPLTHTNISIIQANFYTPANEV